MATGMVNSQHTQTAPAAPAALPQVLRSGEQLHSDLTALKSPDSKTYYHRVPGAKTHMPDGLEIQFLGGVFITANPEIKAMLDKIADSPTSQVYTKTEVKLQLEAADKMISDDAAKSAGTISN